MIDHLSTYARDFLKTRDFYAAAFEPLGYSVQMEFIATWNRYFPTQRMCAFGPEGKPVFCLRPQYHEHYYGAFVIDPDGNNIEAVCHTLE